MYKIANEFHSPKYNEFQNIFFNSIPSLRIFPLIYGRQVRVLGVLQMHQRVYNTFLLEKKTGAWHAREGLMVESFKGDLILTGGRGTGGISFANDVWRSSDGSSW